MKFLISATDPEHPEETRGKCRVCVVEAKSMKDLLMDMYIPFRELRHRTEYGEQVLEAVVWVNAMDPDHAFLIEELPKEIRTRQAREVVENFKEARKES